MKSSLSIPALAAALTLAVGTTAVAGPSTGSPHFRGSHLHPRPWHDRDADRAPARSARVQEAPRYRWEAEVRRLGPRRLSRVVWVRVLADAP